MISAWTRRASTWPVTGIPCRVWNSRSARRVALSNFPSGLPASNPSAPSCDSINARLALLRPRFFSVSAAALSAFFRSGSDLSAAIRAWASPANAPSGRASRYFPYDATSPAATAASQAARSSACRRIHGPEHHAVQARRAPHPRRFRPDNARDRRGNRQRNHSRPSSARTPRRRPPLRDVTFSAAAASFALRASASSSRRETWLSLRYPSPAKDRSLCHSRSAERVPGPNTPSMPRGS